MRERGARANLPCPRRRRGTTSSLIVFTLRRHRLPRNDEVMAQSEIHHVQRSNGLYSRRLTRHRHGALGHEPQGRRCGSGAWRTDHDGRCVLAVRADDRGVSLLGNCVERWAGPANGPNFGPEGSSMSMHEYSRGSPRSRIHCFALGAGDNREFLVMGRHAVEGGKSMYTLSHLRDRRQRMTREARSHDPASERRQFEDLRVFLGGDPTAALASNERGGSRSLFGSITARHTTIANRSSSNHTG